MADKRSLGLMGFLFGCVTLTVVLIGVVVARDHVQGKLHFEDMAMAPQLLSTSAQ
jgi:hypothetical protein